MAVGVHKLTVDEIFQLFRDKIRKVWDVVQLVFVPTHLGADGYASEGIL